VTLRRRRELIYFWLFTDDSIAECFASDMVNESEVLKETDETDSGIIRNTIDALY
jgi:hypothetical protein